MEEEIRGNPLWHYGYYTQEPDVLPKIDDTSMLTGSRITVKTKSPGTFKAYVIWFNHLTKKLTVMGFKQGLVDPCLFFRNGIVLVIYVDDCLIFTPMKERADTFIKELEKRFTIEEDPT